MFTAEATGTQPLNYRWEWKSAMEDGGWQLCDVERFPGATVVVPSVEKSNEGSYCCVVSNFANTTFRRTQFTSSMNCLLFSLFLYM